MNEDNIAWFEDNYPRQSLSALLDLLLAKFREKSGTNTFTVLAANSVSDIKEEFNI